MKILISDLETTGLNPETSEVIEIAGILYDSSSQEMISCWSSLIPSKSDNPTLPVSRIKISATNIYPFSCVEFERMLDNCDVIAGHNFKSFDKKFFDGKPYLPDLGDKPIIDTMELAWPKGDPKRIKLELLALDHGLPVYKAHRALIDCQLICGIFNSYSAEELKTLLEQGLEKRELYVSLEPRPGKISKSLGFKFNHQVPGKWSKTLTASEAKSCAVPVAKVVS